MLLTRNRQLGICITKDLNWNKHIHQITASANRTLAFIRRNLHSCPINIKTIAYTTLVRPLLEYSSSVWDPHTQTLINQIEMVQRRAARFCLNDYISREAGCVSEMLNQLKLHQLKTRRTKSNNFHIYSIFLRQRFTRKIFFNTQPSKYYALLQDKILNFFTPAVYKKNLF